MTNPTKTIPLDQYGLPARELELPQELFAELDRSWDAFVEQRAVTLAQQAHPKPVRPVFSEKPDRTMTIVKWWRSIRDEEEDPKGALLLVGALVSVILAFGSILLFIPPNGVEAVEAILFGLGMNPFWHSMLIDAYKKNGRWWTSFLLLAGAVGMLFNSWMLFTNDPWRSVPMQLEFIESVTSAFLLFLPTRLAWFWKKDSYEAELLVYREAEERWNKTVDAHAQAYEAECMRQRERVANDPSEMLTFLNEGRSTLWRGHLDAWAERLEQIEQAIKEGEQYLEWLQERDDQDSLTARKAAIHLNLRQLEGEREKIVMQQMPIVRSREALERVAMEIQRTLGILDEDRMIEVWHNRYLDTADLEVARTILDKEPEA